MLHLLLYTRRLTHRLELGRVVRDQLWAPRWTAAEERVLRAYGGAPEDVPAREALLLYWLRQAAAHTSQQGSGRSSRYRLWQVRNVDPVLAAL